MEEARQSFDYFTKKGYFIIPPDKLAEYEAFMLGIPTRYGNFAAQHKAFIESTSGLWQSRGLRGRIPDHMYEVWARY